MKIEESRPNDLVSIRTTCPHCDTLSIFTELASGDVGIKDEYEDDYVLGIRKCPNLECSAPLFFIYDPQQEKVVKTYPSVRLAFDKRKIPKNIINAFEEAVKCHSVQCFVASAIMIRKTLEEICHDREVEDKDLFHRLEDLGKKIVLPKELIQAMHDLRLLGNDAAHIEAKTFNNVGKNEIEISIEFTKEILKAVYQYESLLERMKSLKKKKQ